MSRNRSNSSSFGDFVMWASVVSMIMFVGGVLGIGGFAPMINSLNQQIQAKSNFQVLEGNCDSTSMLFTFDGGNTWWVASRNTWSEIVVERANDDYVAFQQAKKRIMNHMENPKSMSAEVAEQYLQDVELVTRQNNVFLAKTVQID